ncbi:MAG: STAS domain-containing protein [Planctomycetes bacterium]|jgi:anti-anti-sigma factor|nr:STAS domain-containing protein [Planctomycetota bacterium]
MSLEIRIQNNTGGPKAGAVTVELTGRLDTSTAPDLERRLMPTLTPAVKTVVFDLQNLNFISSAGLRVFASARKLLKDRGGQAAFVNMQPQINEVFEIIRALPGVAVFRDVAEFDAYLAARQSTYDERHG